MATPMPTALPMRQAEAKDRVALTPSAAVADGADRAPAQGQGGFIGLGRMGEAMGATRAAAGRAVPAYVRRAPQIDRLAALGLHATTQIADVLGCEFIITMLPDDD